jgi:hypothetical protein
MSGPTKGIDANKLVITIAAQKLICPHGNTYPKKAVITINRNRIIPDFHNNCLGYKNDP